VYAQWLAARPACYLRDTRRVVSPQGLVGVTRQRRFDGKLQATQTACLSQMLFRGLVHYHGALPGRCVGRISR
jgi:hypothetical protein